MRAVHARTTDDVGWVANCLSLLPAHKRVAIAPPDLHGTMTVEEIPHILLFALLLQYAYEDGKLTDRLAAGLRDECVLLSVDDVVALEETLAVPPEESLGLADTPEKRAKLRRRLEEAKLEEGRRIRLFQTVLQQGAVAYEESQSR